MLSAITPESLSVMARNAHFLLQRGADANPRIESGHHNLLAMAKTKGNAQIVALLTAAGAKEE